MLCRAFPSSEAKITSLLAPSGALSLASRQRSLALSAINESDTKLAMLLAHRGALVLSSRVASLALPSSIVDASEAAVTSLLAQSVLALASQDRRGLVLRRAEIVL